jgi:sugar phosphate isomerase/epimerase
MKRREFIGTVATGAACMVVGAHAAPAPSYKIGCFTRPWAAHDYRVALDAIAEAGFSYAGFMTTDKGLMITAQKTVDEARAMGEECTKRDLGVLSAYGGGINVAESLEAGIADMKRLIDNCAAAGVGDLLMGGTGKEEQVAPYYKAIAETCDYAEEKGVSISVKPHGGTNATGKACRALIEQVNHPNFRLMYDPGNIFFYSDGALNPIDDAAEVDGIVMGMCVKDFEPPKSVNLTPGDGLVDFPKVLARLKQGGFAGGPLVIECLKEGDLAQTLSEAKRARVFLEGVVAGL